VSQGNSDRTGLKSGNHTRTPHNEKTSFFTMSHERLELRLLLKECGQPYWEAEGREQGKERHINDRGDAIREMQQSSETEEVLVIVFQRSNRVWSARRKWRRRKAKAHSQTNDRWRLVFCCRFFLLLAAGESSY
jgi:hypothetical protein